MKAENESKALAEHFFRLEYAKIVSVITRYFGLSRINLAEDIVQDTLLEAIHTWEFNGIPENPTAWLYTVAKNKALNTLKRLKTEEHYLDTLETEKASADPEFTEEQILDDQLSMMFACCHPAISQDAQVSLILKTLCGLSLGEIANAFLTNNETINKRLVRARKVLREENIRFEIPNQEILNQRLDAVLKTVFLLFNEGYRTSSGDQLINYDLCMEAIRLAELINAHQAFEAFSSPHAISALMLLNASRFTARVDEKGCAVRMEDQDRKLWNQGLINSGLRHLERISKYQQVSIYHILATISAYHCIAKQYEDTNWEGIRNMYEALMKIDNSPIVKLNRAIVIAQVDGVDKGIEQVLALEKEIPKHYYLFHSTLADLYLKKGAFALAKKHLNTVLKEKISQPERALVLKRLALCSEK